VLTNLDMDVLRTLVIAADVGSFAKAATRIGRSQSAVSLQMDKLERQVGRPLFQLRRTGNSAGGLRLTEAGQTIFTYAQRILELNDEAISSARGAEAAGTVRLGITQDLAETWLPVALARFARTHPSILVETTVGRGTGLLDALDQEALDIALVFSIPGQAGKRADTPWRTALPITWIGIPGWKSYAGQVVPLIVFEPPCLFRRAAEEALTAAGQASRVVFQSPSLAGLWSAVSAGLGITIRTPLLIPSGLAALVPKSAGLPVLPIVEFSMHLSKAASRPGPSDIAEVLVDMLEASARSAAV
jgi:DNA-binding transcriptional LysR family regulator